ncbi:hypothetical protein [Bradyrhizobium neotropicale]|uniref:hypothetical protein n=1 Tax=Bradyrhizobium neotropicale TaxID=1497615 RepID=UPI001AD65137|nr:hypothetical protein [Bradyrhizobium neotropicale]MBO4226135.1 hypothetical protein [Bradyrhizobium neotropicale]
MNQMIINGVNSQTFVCSNLERIEHFYTVIIGLRVVKRTVSHLDGRLPVINGGWAGRWRASEAWSSLSSLISPEAFVIAEAR